MNISAINSCCPKPQPNFTSQTGNYENPINRKTEKNLAILSTSGAGALLGATGGLLSTCIIPAATKHRYKIAGGIGLGIAAVTMALTLPAKLYNTKVKAVVKEKEMEVFSRDREVKANILGEVDKEVKDETVPLGEKIDHFATVQMAQNGKGLLVKGA